jgi:hypothetical protein
VFVVVMSFGRSVRMGSSVHAKRNLPHQILKDKARLQSVKKSRPVIPSGTEGRTSARPGHAEGSASDAVTAFHRDH